MHKTTLPDTDKFVSRIRNEMRVGGLGDAGRGAASAESDATELPADQRSRTDVFVRRIRAELAAQETGRPANASKVVIAGQSAKAIAAGTSSRIASSDVPSGALNLALTGLDAMGHWPYESIPRGDGPNPNDFVGCNDREFVERAYPLILGRGVDPSGLENCLKRLKDGASRARILDDLRYSPEGQKLYGDGKKGRNFSDLLNYGDKEFIKAAYNAILGRMPDGAGQAHFLGKLRSGVPKVHVLADLRYSPEGRRVGIPLVGLKAVYYLAKIYRWPVLGPILETCHELVALVDKARARRAFESDVMRMNLELKERVGRALRQIDKHLATVQASHNQLLVSSSSMIDAGTLHEKLAELERVRLSKQAELQRAIELLADRAELYELRSQLIEKLDVTESRLRSQLDGIRSKSELEKLGLSQDLKRIESGFEIATAQSRESNTAALNEVHRLLASLNSDKADTAELRSAQTALRAIEDEKRQISERSIKEAATLGAMYANFEDAFRGTREDIKNRQSLYVSYILEAGVGSANAPVIDLGCGRGEWLELLRENDLFGRGVDVNRTFLDRCRDLSLDVVDSDAIEFLRALDADSVGAVTSFHLIEHLSFQPMLALFDEAFRVVRHGGIVIFETPNPANLQVGANTFYYDPTHRNPLPAPLIKYLIESRGFSDARIIELNPFPEDRKLLEGSEQLKEIVNGLFFGAQDYAVIARKA